MVKNSILRAKIKRSKVIFTKTFLWEVNDISHQDEIIKLFLKSNEEILIYYQGKDNYSWTLTNQRIFIPSELRTIILSDLVKIDFENIIENPNEKINNNKLNLYTKQENFSINVEDKTWHVFYDVFSYIIMKNKMTEKNGNGTD